ncbi:MAG: YbaK/EbsC family protein [Chloroflexi bacterium]|nr:YbaK/EbsC family protein [Chloroflexota bacterium]
MTEADLRARLAALRAELDAAGAEYEIIPHSTTYAAAEDGVAHGLGALAEMAPTFILKTERGPLAAVISGATRLAYKKIKRQLGLKDVSLASPALVQELTGSEVGTVSLIQHGLPTIVDAGLLTIGTGYGGSGVPRHTLKISIADLVRLTGAQVFDFTTGK